MKYKLIERLREYYKLERFHAIWISLFCVFLNVKFGWAKTILLDFGIFLMVFILIQGAYYWKIKLYKLLRKNVADKKVLNRFRGFKNLNLILIFVYPIIIILLYFNDLFMLQRNKYWSLFAYVFGIVEHINYYHTQLMYDNKNDWRYLLAYKKLKVASLRKDLKENKI